MAPEGATLCQLGPEVASLPISEALAAILLCRVADGEQYRRLERKHRELADWIEGADK